MPFLRDEKQHSIGARAGHEKLTVQKIVAGFLDRQSQQNRGIGTGRVAAMRAKRNVAALRMRIDIAELPLLAFFVKKWQLRSFAEGEFSGFVQCRRSHEMLPFPRRVIVRLNHATLEKFQRLGSLSIGGQAFQDAFVDKIDPFMERTRRSRNACRVRLTQLVSLFFESASAWRSTNGLFSRKSVCCGTEVS